MNLKIIFFILSTFITLISFSQEKRIEERIMECFADSYGIDKIEYERKISDYQSLLIKENFLRDGTSDSYYHLIKKIANREYVDNSPSEAFPRELWMFEGKKLIENSLYKSLSNLNWNYDRKTYEEYAKALSSLTSSSISGKTEWAHEMLDVLSKSDFELNFYKVQVFLIFYMIETESGVKSKNYDIQNRN